MYVCVYVCMNLFIYELLVCICLFLSAYESMYECVYALENMYVYTCMCVCVHTNLLGFVSLGMYAGPQYNPIASARQPSTKQPNSRYAPLEDSSSTADHAVVGIHGLLNVSSKVEEGSGVALLPPLCCRSAGNWMRIEHLRSNFVSFSLSLSLWCRRGELSSCDL